MFLKLISIVESTAPVGRAILRAASPLIFLESFLAARGVFILNLAIPMLVPLPLAGM
jgi:hypothetical protein